MKTEKSLIVVFIIGLAFKFLHWPGSGIVHVLSLSTISMLYFPAAFYFFCDKTIKRQNIALSIISGFFLSLIPIGILFKIMYWPGAQMLLLVGTIIAPLFFAIAYYLNTQTTHDLNTYYRSMLLRTGVLTALALLFYLTPTEALIKAQYGNDPELARLKILHYRNPNDEGIKKQYNEYLFKLDSLKRIKEQP